MLEIIGHSLLKSALFHHLQLQELEQILDGIPYRITDFKKREYIYTEHSGQRELGVIIKGKAEVQKNLATGKKIIMNQLGASDTFGMATLFHEDTFVNALMAQKTTSVLYIGEEELLQLFQIDRRILKNYLIYINHKIHFLNQRIECFTNEQTRERVIAYLGQIKSAQQHSSEKIKLTYSKSSLADYLGISRTSLYRVLHALEEDGVISIRGSKVQF